jgi:hypothetical protein
MLFYNNLEVRSACCVSSKFVAIGILSEPVDLAKSSAQLNNAKQFDLNHELGRVALKAAC